MPLKLFGLVFSLLLIAGPIHAEQVFSDLPDAPGYENYACVNSWHAFNSLAIVKSNRFFTVDLQTKQRQVVSNIRQTNQQLSRIRRLRSKVLQESPSFRALESLRLLIEKYFSVHELPALTNVSERWAAIVELTSRVSDSKNRLKSFKSAMRSCEFSALNHCGAELAVKVNLNSDSPVLENQLPFIDIAGYQTDEEHVSYAELDQLASFKTQVDLVFAAGPAYKFKIYFYHVYKSNSDSDWVAHVYVDNEVVDRHVKTTGEPRLLSEVYLRFRNGQLAYDADSFSDIPGVQLGKFNFSSGIEFKVNMNESTESTASSAVVSASAAELCWE